MNLDIEKGVNILTKELNSWVEIIIRSLPNVALALIILVVTLLIAKLVNRITHSLFSKTEKNKAALQLVEKILYLVVIAIGFFIALGVLKLDKTVTSLLAGAGVLGLALGFAFQEIAANFVSGILIAFQEPYRIGDIVQVGSYVGKVKEIELRSTVITTFNGLDVIVPNKNMYTDPLTNYTTTYQRRLDIKVGVGYTEDLRKVETVVKEAVSDIPGRIESEELNIFFNEFGDSSINFELQVWIEYPADNNYNRYRHAAIVAIKEAFDREGITIPYPIRSLDIDVKTIREALSKSEPGENPKP